MTLPLSIGELANLEVLDLYGNKFDHFPTMIRQLPKLKTLDVGISVSDDE